MSANFEERILPDDAGVSRAAAENIVELAERRVKETGHFRIALSGGQTPKQAYLLIAQNPLAARMPWNETQFYFGDERHVSPDHPDSNFRMAGESLFKAMPARSPNIFPIPTSDPNVRVCAEKYESLLRANFRTVPFPAFDLILLGIGPDGHTASLFPGTNAPGERTHWVTWCDPVAVNPAVRPPVKRITITSPLIWNAENVFVLATGASKKPVLEKIFSETEPPNPPVSRLLRECKGKVVFFLDGAAK